MTINRSELFEQIRERVYDNYSSYSPPEETPHEREWRKKTGGRWRNRVGLPRLIAQEAGYEASGLLDSTNLSIFRSDPELERLLEEARDAARAYAAALGRRNWEMFDGKSADSPSEEGSR